MKQKIWIIVFVFLLTIANLSKGFSQWVQTNGPNMADITGFAASGNELYSIIWGSGVFVSIDNGTSWEKRDSGLPNYVWNIFITNSVWLAGTEGKGIYRSTDKGNHWIKANIDSVKINSFVKIDSVLLAGSYGNGIYRSLDNGISWVRADTSILRRWSTHLMLHGKYVFAGSEGGFFRSSDKGESWAQIDTGNINTIFSLDTILLADRKEDGVYVSTDNGNNWNKRGNGLEGKAIHSFNTDGIYFFAVTNQGIFRSSDQGLTWALSNSGISDKSIQCLFVKDSILFAGTAWGGIFRSSDHGMNWASIAFHQTYIYSLAVDNENIYAGTDYVGFFSSGDRGNNWIQSNDGLTYDYIPGLFVADSTIFAGLYDGVYRSTNRGKTWLPPKQKIPYTYFDCFALHGSTIFAGTRIHGVFRSLDNGVSWEKSNTGINDTIILSLATFGENVFAATNSGVYRSTDDGLRWTKINNGLPNRYINAITFIGSILFAGTDGMGVYSSSDFGEHWISASQGLENTFILSLAVYGNNLFAGTLTVYHRIDTNFIPIPSSVFLSKDFGKSWKQMDSGLPISDVSALTIFRSDLYAGTNGKGVWRRPLSDFGINEVKNPTQPDLNISLSPNPTTGIITVHNSSANILHVTVSSILGESVLELEHPNAPDFTLDLSKLPAGTYFVRFSLVNEVVTRKIMKE